jgi:trehalose 6-phosphate phosphatase
MSTGPFQDTDWMDRIADEYVERRRPLALLFDYDGTLTPLVQHPSLARLPLDTSESLRRLTRLPGVCVGVISGRALSDLSALVGTDVQYRAGSGGMEIDLGGQIERYAGIDAADKLLANIRDHILEVIAKFPGTWIEQKPGAWAIHYRGLLPLNAICFCSEITRLLAKTVELRFRVVSESIEVTPADGWDKGSAVLAILSHMEDHYQNSPFPVYFGDAANDAEGMTVTVQAGGVSVGVGSDAPDVAQVRLADTTELAGLLNKFTEHLSVARLPKVAARATLSADYSSLVTQPQRSAKDGDKGLLFVDYDTVHGSRICSAMSCLGWRVWQVASSEAALALAREHEDEISAVVIDLQLPGLQGARTLAELSESNPDVVRCFMSANISPYMATAFGRISDVPLFVKPFFPRELDAKLRAMLATA